MINTIMKKFRILESEKMQFVRGSRLAKVIEASYPQLEKGTKQIRQDAEERANQASVMKMEIHTFPPNNAIDFRALVKGKTNNYQSIVFFKNVDYQQEDTNANLTFDDAKGDVYHISPINLQQQNCQVRCTCPDFRWTFSVQLQNSDSLYGEGPPLYHKKNPDHEPRNPQNIPGVCKHIMALVDELNQLGVFTSGNIATNQQPQQVKPPEQDIEQPEPEQQEPEVVDTNIEEPQNDAIRPRASI